MNSLFFVKAKQVFREPGLYDDVDLFHIHNLAISLTKQIETTICTNADIGIRQLFHNINELKTLYNHHKKSYFDDYSKGNAHDTTAEMLNVLSDNIGQLLRLSLYYFPGESKIFEKEYEEHCPLLLKQLKRRPEEDVDLDRLKYTEPEPIKPSEYFHLLAHTGVIDAVKRSTDEETARELDPDKLNKNDAVRIKCNIDMLFMYYQVTDFNLANARAYVNQYRSKEREKEYQKPRQQKKIIERLAKINQKL